MKRSMRRLVGRLIMLGVLTCLLAFNFTHARSSAAACCPASCCSTCDPTWADCYNQCDAAGGLGACYDFCNREYENCESTCDPGC
jgi:hypothetical protein